MTVHKLTSDYIKDNAATLTQDIAKLVQQMKSNSIMRPPPYTRDANAGVLDEWKLVSGWVVGRRPC